MNLKTSRRAIGLLCVASVLLLPVADAFARGGRGGGGRGGGGMRGGGMSRGGGFSRSPSMSRSMSRPSPSMNRPSPSVSRPSPGISRPSPGVSPGISRPSPGVSRPSIGAAGGLSSGAGSRVGAGPGVGGRPTTGQLNNFLDMGPSGASPGRGVGSSIAAGAVGTGAANFLSNNPGSGIGGGPGSGDRPGVGNGPGVGNRPGIGDGPGVGNRPGIGDRSLADHRPNRVENRQQLNDHRQQRHAQVRDQFRDNHPRFDFWSDHPTWARWRVNRPYRWAAWAAVTSWFPWGWAQPTYYDYGDNVYYEDNSVYYEDQVIPADQYAQQAQTIVESAPPMPADTQESDWMPLGVFAITQDGEPSGPPPTQYLQLQVNRDGLMTGTLQNLTTGDVQQIEGAVDKETQRSAWTVAGKQWPVMETGISNLTKDETAALVHFEDGQTQQWLLVRMDDPENPSN